jgi:hypothetical protein
MYQIKGRIEGVADLLFNQMTEEAEINIRGGTGGGKFTDAQRTDEAKKKYPVDDDNNAIISSWMFKRVLTDGAKAGNLKEGRKSLAPFLLATVFVDGFIRITPNIYDYIHEAPGKRPPKTGGACIIKRPAFKAGWVANFTLNILDDRINANQIRIALEEAGLRVGIGSWRPEYGRFIVTDWNVIQNRKDK